MAKLTVAMIAVAVAMFGTTAMADMSNGVNDNGNGGLMHVYQTFDIYKVLDNACLTPKKSEVYLNLECPELDCVDPNGMPYELVGSQLCIIADAVDTNDDVALMSQTNNGWETVGYLDQIPDCSLVLPKPGSGSWKCDWVTETCFDLDPQWLNDGCYKLKVEGDKWLIPDSVCEIEKARLKCTYAPVPAPGAVILGSMGLGMVGWIKRRFGR